MRMLSTIMTAFMLLAPVAFAEFPKEITIGDKTFEVRQPAEMRKLGFECEDVPWKHNAARLYIEAMNAYQPVPEGLGTNRDILQALKALDLSAYDAEVKAWLEENKKTFALIEEADRTAKCEFPTTRSQPMVGITQARATDVGHLASVLEWRAAYRFGRGDHAGAVDDGTMVLHLGGRVTRHTGSMGWFTGAFTQWRGAQLLGLMAGSGKLDDRMLADISKRLAMFRPRMDDFADSIGRDAAYLKLFAEYLHKGIEPLLEHMGLAKRIWQRFEWRLEESRNDMLYEFYESRARMPLHEAVKPENSFTTRAAKNPQRYGPVDKEVVKGFDGLLVLAVQWQVVFDFTGLRIGLERHRLANKGYPKTLHELVPAYLEKVPVDPFSGKPYRYTRTDGGFRLWSFGKDRKDDGGRADTAFEPDIRITQDKGSIHPD